jgi:metal-responsive CopG/Arc/MetJ family transcriptional regulator
MKTKSGTATVRASISFPTDIYETLDLLAKEKKVSLAWVVRDAAEKYVTAGKKTRQDQKSGRKSMAVRTS